MRTFTLSLLLLVTVFYSNAQNEPRIIIDVPSQQKPWNTIEWNDAPEQFQFAIVSDRTGGHRPGVFLKGVQRLNLLQPEFVMSVGDLIEGYTRDTSRLNAEWTEFMGFIDSLQAPFFYVPGNHDITNEVMEKKWEELFGVTYYHFVYKDVLFLCLNSEDNYRGAGRGMIDDAQYEYIKRVLEENQDVKWTLAFLHQPLWVQEDTKRWADVEKLLEGRNHNVFAGHYHRYWKTERNNGKYIALATTGGGSPLRGTAYGEFDHVVWVTMTPKGPLLTNLLLDGIWDENVVTEDIVELVRNKPFPVQIAPVYLEDVKANSLQAEVKITNTSDHRMSVEIDGLVHPTVFYQLERSQITVEPNDVVTFELSVKNSQSIDLTIIKPLRIPMEVTYELDDRPNVVLKNELQFLPMPKPVIGGAGKKVKVDGGIKEWSDASWLTIDPQNVRGRLFDYDGASDCSIRFASSYDDQNLYLAFDIKDEEIYTSDLGSLWQQDALIVGLDARPQHISAANSGEGRNDEWMMYLRAFRDKDAVYNPDDLPSGLQAATNRSKEGVTVELSVPLSYLDKMQKASWTTFRLGVGYYDYDEKGEERTEHFWYPAWNAGDNIPGSGMMFRGE